MIVNLRSDLNRLTESQRNSLRIEFIIIHLCEEDPVIISNKTKNTKESLKESIETIFPDTDYSLKNISPQDMGAQQEIRAKESPQNNLVKFIK